MTADGSAAVRAVRAQWDAATRDGAAACGLPVAVAAFERMRLAWSAELGAYADVFDQLASAAAAGADSAAGAGAAAAREDLAPTAGAGSVRGDSVPTAGAGAARGDGADDGR